MTSESGGSQEKQWIIEPAPAGGLKFIFQPGEGAMVGEEVRAALDQLVDAIQGQAEVEGYYTCTSKTCLGLTFCPSDSTNGCQPYYYGPCAYLESCTGKIKTPSIS